MRPFIKLATFFIAATVVQIASAQSTFPAIFITNNVGDSVTSMTVNPDGSLSYVGTYTSGEGPQAISLTPDGRILAVSHGTISSTTEELRLFSVNADASLSPLLNTTVFDSPLDVQWLDNTNLAVTQTSLSSNNNVRTYTYQEFDNTLIPMDIAPSGDFNTALDLRDDGEFLFANSSLGTSSIFSYAVDGANLTQADNELFPTGFAVDIKASRDGNFLYGAGGISEDDRRIYAFSVGANGALEPLSTPSFMSPGDSPKVIGVTEDDSVLVVGHGGDGTARTLLRNTATGALTPAGGFFDAGGRGNLGDLQVMGDLLFVTSESDQTATSLRIGSDGTLTQLGPAVGTNGARPEYIATWEGLMAALLCDFDADDNCDIDDLNLLLAEGPIAGGVAVVPGTNDQYDLNNDGTIDLEDRDEWLALAGDENGFASPYKVGDANLDGVVDGQDFIAWNENKFTSSLQWDLGDFTGDGVVDGQDFIEWNANKFMSSDFAAVPEPMGFNCIVWLLAIGGGISRSQSWK